MNNLPQGEKISLNTSCSVVLTKEGAAHITDVWLDFAGKKYEEGDTYKAQLWSLMQDFGPVMRLGGPVLFKDCEVEVANEQCHKDAT